MFLNYAIDVHGRARSKRQHMSAHNESSDDKVNNSSKIERDARGSNKISQPGIITCQAQDEESSVASSLFSHSENDHVNSPVNKSINFTTYLETKPPANPENDESSDEGSLFSRSSQSAAPMAPADAKANPPLNFELAAPSSKSEVEATSKYASVDGRCDDSSSFTFNHRESMLCNDEQLIVSESTASPYPDNQEIGERPIYETFERPAYKPDDESDFESSDEGSLFSLEEHEDETAPSRCLQSGRIPRKKASLTSFGTPIIPRKKTSSRPVTAITPAFMTPNSSFVKPAGQSPHKRVPDHDNGVKKKVMPKSRVSFVEDGKRPKCVGRSARALKVPRPQEERGCNLSSKQEGEENDIFSWQKSYEEKQWNREFSKLRLFIKSHGHCDVPDGHTLSGWIRRQQRVCQRWLLNSYNPRESISDKEFQTVVHIFRLQNIGFEWGSRIQHRIPGAILDWSNMLDLCQRKILLNYGKMPSLSIARLNTKATVKSDVSSSDEECELIVAMSETKHNETKGKQKRRDRDDDGDRMVKYGRRGKNDDVRSFLIVNSDTFKDERPHRLSWSSTAHDQSARDTRFEMSSVSWDKIIEIHRKNISANNFASISSNEKCWFDVHHVVSVSPAYAHVLSTDTRSVESSFEKGLSGSSESENEKQYHSLMKSHPAAQRQPQVMHEVTPIETALLVRHHSRKNSSRTEDSGMNSPKSFKVTEVTTNCEKRWFDLEIAESRPANTLNKFQISLRKIDFEKQTYITNLETMRTSCPFSAAVTPHHTLHAEATTTNTEKKTISIESVPCDTATTNNRKHSDTSIDKLNADANGETMPDPIAEEAAKKVGQQTSKPTSSTVQYNRQMVGPEGTKISSEQSEEFVGWSVRRMSRKDGGTYCYYYSPQLGFRCRSKQDVKRFIKILKEKGNEASAIKEYGLALARKKAPTKTKTPTIDETPPNSLDSGNAAIHPASMLGEGDDVYAAWWSTKKRKVQPVFYLGVVKSVRLSETGNGRSRVYDIRYADGDELNGIDEGLVIPKHEYIHNNLKPVYMLGDKVYSAWWPETKNRKRRPSWYPGIVKGRRELPRGGRYGPSIVYDILFDDGDEHDDVEDHFVFLRVSDQCVRLFAICHFAVFMVCMLHPSHLTCKRMNISLQQSS
eukprot:CCRYP_015218-RC/>CCRYP_015218-RC protein AED:0.02 eAED:0.02 QI:476/1/1/1/0.83/0.57/7/1681/1140